MSMRVWIDLANSPHVPLMSPVTDRLSRDGHEVLVTVRDHAQTLPLAARAVRRFVVVGGRSPDSRRGKAVSVARRAGGLRRTAAAWRPDVALSHGSYAQLLAAASLGVPSVTMMDYEYQPANHLSFRLATRVLVPDVFPQKALIRCGASPPKVVRYGGFKEQLYLAGFVPDPSVLSSLGLDATRLIVVFRPPPEGALYHRMGNSAFERLLAHVAALPGAQAVLLPRHGDAERYRELAPDIVVPEAPVDGQSLLALADAIVGAGGTMNREGAVLGTPTFTMFAGELAAVDRELIRQGRMVDLRLVRDPPVWRKKEAVAGMVASTSGATGALEAIMEALSEVSRT